MKDEIMALLDKVQAMRQAQNAYFKFKGDPDHKKGILIRSKQLETEVDIDTARLRHTLLDGRLNEEIDSHDKLLMSERARVIGELSFISFRVDSNSKAYLDKLIEDLKANRKVPA